MLAFNEFMQEYKKLYPGVPDDIWIYFEFERLVLDMWRRKECQIIYVDGGDYVPLEDTGDHFEIWKGKEVSWFLYHPCKDKFYIVQ